MNYLPPGLGEAEQFRRAVDLIDAGDVGELRAQLRTHPELARLRVGITGAQYFSKPSLLDFIAQNPVRGGALPANIVEVASTILDAGAREDPSMVDSALGLVASGRVPRESGVQVALIDFLCDSGADPNRALRPALVHSEFAAAEALLRRGAAYTLAAAAAFGRTDDVVRLLPGADGAERHAALALAAYHGHADSVAVLLDAGEDPNRYNPDGHHAHGTPLHHAASNGHAAVVRLLVERGARTDLKDHLFDGTPLGWAEHAEQTDVANYLRTLP
jgi:peptide-methionine (S)-S-oxide reductase